VPDEVQLEVPEGLLGLLDGGVELPPPLEPEDGVLVPEPLVLEPALLELVGVLVLEPKPVEPLPPVEPLLLEP